MIEHRSKSPNPVPATPDLRLPLREHPGGRSRSPGLPAGGISAKPSPRSAHRAEGA
jgi:hypothetical protein